MQFTIAVLVIGITTAAPQSNLPNYAKDIVQILKYENDDLGGGSYRFAFEQSDGTKHEQQGEVINGGTDNAFVRMNGVFSWVGPDGLTYTVSYTADENGFNPKIEQGPPGSVPRHIGSLIG